MWVNQAQERNKISSTGACCILSPFLGEVPQHRSTHMGTSNLAGGGLSRLIEWLGLSSHQGEKSQGCYQVAKFPHRMQ